MKVASTRKVPLQIPVKSGGAVWLDIAQLGLSTDLSPVVYLELSRSVHRLQDGQYREDLRQLNILVKYSAPPAKIVEYLLAPSFKAESGAATREEIATKFYENVAPDYDAVDRSIRALSVLMGVVAAGGIATGLGVLTVGAIAGHSPIAAGLRNGGIAIAHFFNEELLAAFIGAGGWFANHKLVEFNKYMKKARRAAMAPTGLNKLLSDDNGPEALRGKYGFKNNQATFIGELAKIPHPERHLLKHFSPHDLRVFLLSSDEGRVEQFTAQPPPADNQRLWRLATRHESGPGKFVNLLAVKDELEVMLQQWKSKDSTILKSPVSMGRAIKRMRERYSDFVSVPAPAHFGSAQSK
jgi:hypothetical protein